MTLSRERAVDLSHRMVDRFAKTPGIELGGEREFVRNQVMKAVLEWDRELERLTAEVKSRIAARSRRVVEGTREWDLLLSEELTRALTDLLGRGE